MRNPAAACVVRGRFVLTQNVAPPFSFFFLFFVDVEHPLFPLSSQPQRTDEAIAAAAAAGGAAVVVELLLWWSAPNSPSKLKSDI